jgi:hypothetical protein
MPETTPLSSVQASPDGAFLYGPVVSGAGAGDYNNNWSPSHGKTPPPPPHYVNANPPPTGAVAGGNFIFASHN